VSFTGTTKKNTTPYLPCGMLAKRKKGRGTSSDREKGVQADFPPLFQEGEERKEGASGTVGPERRSSVLFSRREKRRISISPKRGGSVGVGFVF